MFVAWLVLLMFTRDGGSASIPSCREPGLVVLSLSAGMVSTGMEPSRHYVMRLANARKMSFSAQGCLKVFEFRRFCSPAFRQPSA